MLCNCFKLIYLFVGNVVIENDNKSLIEDLFV